MKSLNRIQILIAAMSLFAVPRVVRAVEPERPAVLEVSAESRMPWFDVDGAGRVVGHELNAGIGLAWMPNDWISVHGRISGGWTSVLDDAFSYRYKNSTRTSSCLGSLELAAFLDFHPGIPVLTVRAELAARSYFASGRAGIWMVTAGLGVGGMPLERLHAALRTIYFGVMCRVPVFDDFDAIFNLKRRMPEIGLQVSWGF